jgi:hypothetical protein
MTRLLSLAVLCAVTAQNPQTPPPAGTAKISGVVTRQDSGLPLPDVTVRAIRWEGGYGTQIPAKRSGPDGRFTFDGLLAGEYDLTFSAERFVSLRFGQKVPQDTVRQITLKDAMHFDHADIALPPTTAIEGRLFDEFGDPVPGVVVQVATVVYAAGKRRLMPVGSGALPTRPTDDLGQFRVFNLPPGDYYLLALAGPFAGPDDPAGFAVTYFPGTRVPTEAKPVRLEIGRDVTGVSMQLSPAAMSTVSGVVVDENDRPIAGGSVMLLPTSGGDVRSLLMGRLGSGPDGTFVFRNVAPGTYVIQAYGRPEGGGNIGRAPFASVPLDVGEGADVADLRVKVRGASARGRIVFDGDAPLPSLVTVSPRAVNFASAPVGGGPPNSVTNPDWTFEVRNMSGLRVIDVNVRSTQWILKQVTRDGRDITDEPVDFREGDVSGLEITLTSRTATLAGTVTDPDGAVSESTVVLFASDPARWTYPARYLAATRPTPQGTFRLPGLRAGDYLAAALPFAQGTDWQDPEYLKELVVFATRVTLSEGGAGTVALKVIRR